MKARQISMVAAKVGRFPHSDKLEMNITFRDKALARLAFGVPLILASLMISACDPVYPLVMNGYSSTVAVTSIDENGRGGYLHWLMSGQCLEVMHTHPNLTRIIVVKKSQQTRTYSKEDIARASNHAIQDRGVFVVDETGLSFTMKYQCYSPKMQNTH